MVDASATLEQIRALSADFARERASRQQRRELDPADFDRLRDTGFLLSGVPTEEGGIWESAPRSTRVVCELLRALARGDSSVALVCAMHPTVLGFWLATPRVPEPFSAQWDEQRRQIFDTVRGGAWWGTIVSEPGSGGDLSRTRAVATRDTDGAGWRLSGDKQFGSGSGITSHMITVAVPEGEEQPDLFALNVHGARWDGSDGMKLVAAWDGHGMIATQSHAFRFEGYPATRCAWPSNVQALGAAAQPYIRCCFTAVFVGIVQEAIATAHAHLEKKRASLRPYELVEWARARMEGWLLEQAYEGMLRAIELEANAGYASVQGKLAAAELAESALTRLCRVIGGGAFARSSPFGIWAQDVRALGYLRPPWSLAFDLLIEGSWSAPSAS
jgi:alkylation response protein AidB-like acyl-CoA dehydrogenase